jgi:hypothetical protein
LPRCKGKGKEKEMEGGRKRGIMTKGRLRGGMDE